MRLLITGSRSWDDADYIWRVLDGWLTQCEAEGEPLELHHGACGKGADSAADGWAIQRLMEGRSVRVLRYPAQWRTTGGIYDRRAGFRRNAEMVAAVKALGGTALCVAFVRDRSGGATNCANEATKAGIPTIRRRWEDRDVPVA